MLGKQTKNKTGENSRERKKNNEINETYFWWFEALDGGRTIFTEWIRKWLLATLGVIALDGNIQWFRWPFYDKRFYIPANDAKSTQLR